MTLLQCSCCLRKVGCSVLTQLGLAWLLQVVGRGSGFSSALVTMQYLCKEGMDSCSCPAWFWCCYCAGCMVSQGLFLCQLQHSCYVGRMVHSVLPQPGYGTTAVQSGWGFWVLSQTGCGVEWARAYQLVLVSQWEGIKNGAHQLHQEIRIRCKDGACQCFHPWKKSRKFQEVVDSYSSCFNFSKCVSLTYYGLGAVKLMLYHWISG